MAVARRRAGVCRTMRMVNPRGSQTHKNHRSMGYDFSRIAWLAFASELLNVFYFTILTGYSARLSCMHSHYYQALL